MQLVLQVGSQKKKRTGVVGCLSGMKKKNATAIAGWLT